MEGLPRYFTTRSMAASDRITPTEPDGVLDHFWLQQVGGDTECVVATDGSGNLVSLCGAQLEQLAEELREEQAYHELSEGQRIRRIEAQQFYLFNSQLLEQPTAAPGLDDPLYLYGTLFGPFPSSGSGPVLGVEGQLTTTRADLLAGLIYGVQNAFCYAESDSADAATTSQRHCYHVLLPGDRQEEIEQGRGMILAYPLLPSELFRHDSGNELVIRQLLYDLLKSLREDLAQEGISHPLRDQPLPVPSRTVLEQELLADGYVLDGETARRTPVAGNGAMGLLRSVLGHLLVDEVVLPKEGTLEDYLRIARQVLGSLPGFPSERARSLQQRVTRAVSTPTGLQIPVQPKKQSPHLFPASATETAVPPPSGRRLTLPARADPADWMRDFGAGPRSAGRPPARITSAQAIAKQQRKPKPAGTKRNEPPTAWMQDFADLPGKHEPEKTSSQGTKADWMSDFEEK